MMEPETNEPMIERLTKIKIAYHTLLLLGINRAREALAFGSEGTNEIDALIAILPPEVLEDISPSLRRMKAELIRKLGGICDRLDEYRLKPVYYRQYNEQRLSLIIRSLDEHGLLREYRSEEVGHE
jgi:hypothetical protein